MDTLTGVEHLAEPDGFRDFVEARSSALLRSGWLLTGDWPSAEDLVQTALAAAWPHWASLRRQDAPELYVRKIMVNTFLRWRQRRWTGEIATGRLPETQAYDMFAQVDARQSLLAALDRLPARQRAVVVLRYFADQNRVADRGGDGLLGGRGEVARGQGAGPAQGRAGPGRPDDRRGGVVNTEERNLADVLHRITPEPPRRVTVEQVAYRLVSEPRLGRQPRAREPRPRRGSLALSRAFAPVLAAAAIVVIAGASAGIAVLANSHHNPPAAVGGTPTSSSASSAPVSSSPSQTSSSPEQITPGTNIAGGPWGAALIDQQTFNQASLASGDGSLYAYGTGTLDRIDPATGIITATAPYNPPYPNPPVIIGNTVWVLWSFSGGNVVLHGFDARTLAPTGSVLVPAIGPVAVSSASNVVTSGPDGDLYVAAGDAVAVVNPDNGQVIRRIYLTEGTTNSVAVSPDGSRLYVGIGGFKLVVYDLANHTVANVSSLTGTDSGGNLVATSGGVWGITGVGMSEWTWFAPSGDLGRAVRIGYGAGPASPRSPATAGAWSGSAARTRSAAPARSTGRSWTPRPCPPTTAWWSTSAAPRWSAATPTPTTRTTGRSSPAWSA